MAVSKTKIKEKETDEEKYFRLLNLCNGLAQELDTLKKDWKVLRAELQKTVDKQRIKNVLEKIVNQRQ